MWKKSCCLIITSLLIVFSAFAMPQAVIFDFGGVLTGKPDRAKIVQFICACFDLSKEEFEALNIERKAALEAGSTDEQFWLDYAQQKAIALPEDWSAQFRQAIAAAIGANQSMYDLVYELKQQSVVVGMLSNIDHHVASLVRICGLYEPFDPCILSCDIGFNKPDPAAYYFLLDTLQLPPDAVVFIDDRRENIESALQIGIDAILFTSEEQLREELNTRGL